MISDPLASLDLNRADVALRLVATLVATGQLIAGAQLIAERRLFERGGLLWWPAVRRRYQSSRFAVLSTMPFTPRAVIGTALLKCSGAVALVGCAVWQQPLRYALIVLLAANFALFIRMPHGRTGADEMGNVILLALLLSNPRPLASVFLAPHPLPSLSSDPQTLYRCAGIDPPVYD